MQTPHRGAPNLLFILLGPILLAVGRAAMDSQGEETTELLLLPAAGILVALLWADKWTHRVTQAGNLNLGHGEFVRTGCV